jgi:hypothetical protein
VPLVEEVRVVVRQLFAGFDVADRLDPDASVLDYGIAIRRARVIDEPRLVSVDGGVDDDVVVDREEIRVMALIDAVGIPRIRSTASRRECDASRTRRAPASVTDESRTAASCPTWWSRQRGVFRDSTCVTPPEMMYAMTAAASASMRRTRSTGTTSMCPANPYDCGM